jgi:hypothetical protein
MYIVLDEHTLGYTDDLRPSGILQILHSFHYARLTGWTSLPCDLASVRPATLEDFARFRVSPPPDLSFATTKGANTTKRP